MYLHREFLPPGIGPLSFYKDKSCVFKPQEYRNSATVLPGSFYAYPHTKCSFFNNIIANPVMFTSSPESRMAGEGCWGPPGWCPSLLLHRTVCWCWTWPYGSFQGESLEMQGFSPAPSGDEGALLGFWGDFLSYFYSLLKRQLPGALGSYFTVFLTGCVTLGKSSHLRMSVSSFVDRELGSEESLFMSLSGFTAMMRGCLDGLITLAKCWALQRSFLWRSRC